MPESIRTAVRNNGGGHVNHSMFWQIMASGAGGAPVGNLAGAINAAFGGFDQFKEKFDAAGHDAVRLRLGVAGQDRAASSTIYSTANQDSPLMEGKFPVIGLDVWEHAYYLQVSEPPARLHRRLVERGELAGSREAVQRRQVVLRGDGNCRPHSMPTRTAIVAGATGLVGSHVLSLLIESPHYTGVTALVRRRLDREHPKLKQLVVDFDRLPPLPEADDVFCALGTTIKKAGSREAFRRVDYEYPVAIARQAAEAGDAQFLLVSSVGADRHSSNFYLRTKGEVEDAIGALPFRGLHVFRPSFLIGERADSRPGERFGIAAARIVGPLLAGPLRKYRAIPAEAVARAMVESAVRAEAGRHEYTFGAMAPFIRS